MLKRSGLISITDIPRPVNRRTTILLLAAMLISISGCKKRKTDDFVAAYSSAISVYATNLHEAEDVLLTYRRNVIQSKGFGGAVRVPAELGLIDGRVNVGVYAG